MGNALILHRVIRRLLLSVLLLSMIAVGCSKSAPTGTVKGKVTLDDEPYSNAAVMIVSMETGQGGTADIQSDGTFTLAEPIPVGSYTAYLAPKASENETQEAQAVTIDTSVPDKYWSEMSDIKVDVAEGENDVTVPLKSGG
jgi:hypothetical protein